MRTVPEILEAAAALLDERGWCQATFGYDGPRCALGALITVTHQTGEWEAMQAEYNPAKEALNAALGEGAAGVMFWNDAKGRTKEEVTSTMRSVAAIERARAARMLPVVIQETVTA